MIKKNKETFIIFFLKNVRFLNVYWIFNFEEGWIILTLILCISILISDNNSIPISHVKANQCLQQTTFNGKTNFNSWNSYPVYRGSTPQNPDIEHVNGTSPTSIIKSIFNFGNNRDEGQLTRVLPVGNPVPRAKTCLILLLLFVLKPPIYCCRQTNGGKSLPLIVLGCQSGAIHPHFITCDFNSLINVRFGGRVVKTADRWRCFTRTFGSYWFLSCYSEWSGHKLVDFYGRCR